MIDFSWHRFSELSTEQLYAILSLRAEVFVVEQHCPFQDPDGLDPKAMHLLCMERGSLVGYLRLFPPENNGSLVFGRIITSQSVRGRGYGIRLMQELLHYCTVHYPQYPIKCSAQYRLREFYARFGFVTRGEVYQEDDMPHIEMVRNAPNHHEAQQEWHNFLKQ